MKPESLKESALVPQAIRAAMVGELAVIEEILDTYLPSLPKWWSNISSKSKTQEIETREAKSKKAKSEEVKEEKYQKKLEKVKKLLKTRKVTASK